MASAVQHVSLGDYAMAAQGNKMVSVAGDLTEKIEGIRSSVAAVQQQLIAPVVWLGSQQVNVLQLMLDTLDVVKQLAEQTAGHKHPSVSTPTNAAAINQTGSSASALKQKYDPFIS